MQTIYEIRCRIRVRLVALALCAGTSGAFANCLDYEACHPSDITCNPQAWFLYLYDASLTTATEPALCSGGSSAVTGFYGFYGGNGNDIARSVCATRDGGYLTVGSAGADIASLGGQTPILPYQGAGEGMILKLDQAGSVEWYSFIGGAGADNLEAVTETEDGGYVAVGSSTTALGTLNGIAPIIGFQGTQDWLVIRFNSTGSIEWWTYLGDIATSPESATSIVPTVDGGYLVTGVAADMDGMPVAAQNTYAGSTFDITAVKLNALGIVQWFRYFGSGVNEQALGAVPTADGNFVTAGVALGTFTNVGGVSPLLAFNGPGDAPVIKFGPTGNLIWHTFLGGAGGSQNAEAITETADGSLVVLMESASAVATLGGLAPLTAFNAATEIYVAKLSTDGAVLWHTFLGTTTNDSAGHIAAFPDGSILVAGRAPANIPTLGGKTPLNAYNAGDEILLVKLTSDGAIDWYTFVGGVNAEEAFGLAITRDGGFILSGSTNSNIASIGSLTSVNPFVNANEFFVLRGTSSGTF